MLRIDRQIAPVPPHEERGRIVIVLLEVRVQDRRCDRSRGDVVHGDFDVAPSGIAGARRERPDGAHGPRDDLAVADDGARVHEPGPGAVVVQPEEASGDVVIGIRLISSLPGVRSRRRGREHGGDDNETGDSTADRHQCLQRWWRIVSHSAAAE
jgi:hypothetical protein